MENYYDTPSIDMMDYGDNTSSDLLWEEYMEMSTSSDWGDDDNIDFI